MSEGLELEAISRNSKLRAKIKIISLIVLLALIIGILLFFLFLAFQDNKTELSTQLVNTPTEIKLDHDYNSNSGAANSETAGGNKQALDVDKMWKHQLEENLDSNSVELNNKINELKEELVKSSKELDSKKDHEIRSLQEKIKFLEAEFGEVRKQEPSYEEFKINAVVPKINRYNVALSNPKNVKDYQQIKTAENYIAAGSFVQGRLLSGVDVSTAIKTLNDPEPVLIRLTDVGTLPRKFKSDLKDCHIIGSAYGDLSSERAKIRAEKLSCTEISSGEIIETEISGYIAGEDGKSGIRGTVVSVDQKYLMNAQLLGTLAGVTKTINQEQVAFNPFVGNASPPRPQPNNSKIAGNILSSTEGSLDKLTEYYIERAETIQPVIQIAAGRKIDVVFTEGVYFGASHLKANLAKKREERIKHSADQESNNLLKQMQHMEQN